MARTVSTFKLLNISFMIYTTDT